MTVDVGLNSLEMDTSRDDRRSGISLAVAVGCDTGGAVAAAGLEQKEGRSSKTTTLPMTMT